jgi:hypothetical protein
MLSNIIRNTTKTATGDPYYSNVSLLLHMDGANGSTTFTDSSLNALAVTPVGNAQISTTQSKYGGASGYFDGSGDYLDTSGTGIATAFGTGDFTIEFWYYPLTVSVQQNLVDKIGSASNAIYMSSAGVLKYYVGADRITGSTLSANTWYHIALVRYSGTTKLYVNGVQSGASYDDTNNYALNTGSPRIGAAFNNTVSVNGYIDDFRISRFARYVSNFTPPTAALPTTASSTVADPYYDYTSLLLHMDGTNGSTNFVDSGPNAMAISRSGTPTISTTQSKFGEASGFFDGTAGYIFPPTTAAFSFGTADFTIESWVYPTRSASGNLGIYAISAGGGAVAKFVVFLDTLTPNCHFFGLTNGNNIYTKATSAVAVNQWSHIAFVRSGTTWTWYINGVASGSGTNSTNIGFTTQPIYIGYGGQEFFNYFQGYIDDLRITKYARTITVPTAPYPNY